MKALILGDGLLGSEIQKQTGWNWISRKKDGIEFCNIETYKEFLKDCDTIINCIAYTDTYSDDKTKHYEINYKAVVELERYCRYNNKKLVHISTDYVYAGSIRFAKETDLPIPSPNWYTYTKLLADEYIQLKNEKYLICRCSFKPTPFPYETAWEDQIGNFDYANIIAELIIKCIQKEANGIYNIGTGLKSIYDLALQTNPNVKKGYAPKHVPKNITMNLDKLNSINE